MFCEDKLKYPLLIKDPGWLMIQVDEWSKLDNPNGLKSIDDPSQLTIQVDSVIDDQSQLIIYVDWQSKLIWCYKEKETIKHLKISICL